MKNPPSRIFILMVWSAILAILLISGSEPVNAQASKQVLSVPTLADLEARTPATGETVEVRNGSSSNLWSAPRLFVHQTSSETADRVYVVTNRTAGTRYIATDRGSSIKDAAIFGAIGDGVTDDTAAIQAAIDSLPLPATNSLFVERGGSVFIPAGTYKITAPLRMRPGKIEGSSRFSTVLINYGLTNDVIACMTPSNTPPTGIWLYRVAHMSIHQADTTVPTAGAAIRVQSDDNATASMADVEDVFIHGTFRGFHGSALQGSSLKDVTIYASKDDGILWDVYQTMVQASGCWTYYCGQNGTGHGWHLQGPAYCTVTASGADSNYGWGWYVESGTVQAPRGNNFTVGAEQNRDGGILIKNAIGGVYSPMVVTPDDLPTAADGIVVDNGRMVGLVGAFTQQGAIGGTGYPLRITNGVPDYPSVTVNASYLNSYNTGSEYHQTIGIGTYLPWEERGFIGLNTDGKPRRMLDVHDRTGAAGNTTGHELARLALHTADTNGNAYISITPDGETTFHRIIANNLRAATTFNYGTNGDTVFLGPSAPLSGDNGSFLFQLGTTPVMSIKGGDTLGGVGIGTTRPNPAALLDIRSSTRGLLLPSWTSSEYTGGLYGSGIFTPPGLLSYDSTDRRVRVQTRNATDGLTNNQYTTLFGYVDRDLRLGTAHRQIGKIWPQSVHATDTNIGSVYIYFTAENVVGLEIEQNSFRAGPFQYGTFGDTIIRNSYSNSAGAYGNLLLMAGDLASVTIGNGTARGTVTISNDLVVADSITLGGVARTSWPSAAVNVKDFGAIPDDGGDDTAAVLAAFAAAPARGTIYFPHGRYLVTAPLPLASYQTIRGDGYGSMIAVSHSGAGFHNPVPTNRVEDVRISSLAINTANGNRPYAAITLTNVSYAHIERTFIHAYAGKGFQYGIKAWGDSPSGGAWSSTFIDNTIYAYAGTNGPAYAIYASGGPAGGYGPNSWRIFGNYLNVQDSSPFGYGVTNNGAAVVYLENFNGAMITDNIMEGYYTNSIHITNAAAFTVKGNRWEHGYGTGGTNFVALLLQNVTNAVVAGNMPQGLGDKSAVIRPSNPQATILEPAWGGPHTIHGDLIVGKTWDLDASNYNPDLDHYMLVDSTENPTDLGVGVRTIDGTYNPRAIMTLHAVPNTNDSWAGIYHAGTLRNIPFYFYGSDTNLVITSTGTGVRGEPVTGATLTSHGDIMAGSAPEDSATSGWTAMTEGVYVRSTNYGVKAGFHAIVEDGTTNRRVELTVQDDHAELKTLWTTGGGRIDVITGLANPLSIDSDGLTVKSNLVAEGSLSLGGVARTSWPSAAVNVKDFGAIPDDGGDDTAAFESAIAAAIQWRGTNGGGKIYVPQGDYHVNVRWGMSTNEESFTLEGDGPSASALLPVVSTEPVLWVSGRNVTVRDLMIKGSLATPSGTGLRVGDTNQTYGSVVFGRFENIRIYDFDRGIQVDGADQTIFESVVGWRCTNALFLNSRSHASSPNNNVVSKVKFLQCTFAQSYGDAAIKAIGGLTDQIEFSTCAIEQNEGAAAIFEQTSAFDGNPFRGIQFQTCYIEYNNWHRGPGAYYDVEFRQGTGIGVNARYSASFKGNWFQNADTSHLNILFDNPGTFYVEGNDFITSNATNFYVADKTIILSTDTSFRRINRVGYASTINIPTLTGWNVQALDDTIPKISADATGNLLFGAGGTNPANIVLHRIADGRLALEGELRARTNSSAGNAFSTAVVGESFPRLNVLAGGRLEWRDGATADTIALERAGAGLMQMSDAALALRRSAGSKYALRVYTASGDYRTSIRADGAIEFTDGTNMTDVVLLSKPYTATNQLTLDGTLRTRLILPADSALLTAVSGEAFSRFEIDASGRASWGDGTGPRTHASLERTAPGELTLKTNLVVSGSITLGGVASTGATLYLTNVAGIQQLCIIWANGSNTVVTAAPP